MGDALDAQGFGSKTWSKAVINTKGNSKYKKLPTAAQDEKKQTKAIARINVRWLFFLMFDLGGGVLTSVVWAQSLSSLFLYVPVSGVL